MRVLNFGSLNIDKVYGVKDFVKFGETISAHSFERNVGGKGLNQSIALARAGLRPFHAGAVGFDGQILIEMLANAGVNTENIKTVDIQTGHAIIQINDQGNNSIISYGGANSSIDKAFIDSVLSKFSPGDFVIIQNEISNVEYLLWKAHERGLKVVFNPSPATENILDYSIDICSIIILNEIEGNILTGEIENERILNTLAQKYKNTEIVLTIGPEGVLYANGNTRKKHCAYNVPVIDTTAAGDTFCGYFIASAIFGDSIDRALSIASAAAAIAISRKGAAASIPTMKEVFSLLN